MAEQQPTIECSGDSGFADWLREANGSIILSTYQAGKVALIGWDGHSVRLLMRHFDKPLGLAVRGQDVALATRNEVVFFSNAPLLARDYLPDQPGRYDAVYLPRASYFTGDVNAHDIAFDGDGNLWVINTRFGCLAGLSRQYSFVPCWKPPFISQIAPEDRCHLNGLAMFDGKPRWVTALGETNTPGGWREKKATGGIVVDVATNEIIVRDLAMPHSPRWHAGALWLLNSGAGELLTIDLSSGLRTVVCTLPGYLRGLCFVGDFALLGLCRIREKHIFGGLPVEERWGNKNLLCGVAVINLRTGRQVGLFRFTEGCQELYDVQFLASIQRAIILNSRSDVARDAFTAPQFSYWLRPAIDREGAV